MTRKQKAVEVAKDVLAQLRKRQNGYKARPSLYIQSSSPLNHTDDLQARLPDIQAGGCPVCALGAALLSKARLYDKMVVEDIFPYNCKSAYGGLVRENLTDIFTPRQLDLMESAFEKMDINGDGRSVAKAIEFGQKYPEPKARMRAIMQNIIDNEGTFTP